MAENKKSFVLYADLIHTVKKMPKDKAGELLLTILQYVNDENPVVEDMVVDLVFEPIKRQMKRDLKKYEISKGRYSKAGKASAEARRAQKEGDKNSTSFNVVQHGLTKSTVTVNDNVTVNVNDILLEKETKFDFRKSLIDYGFDENLVRDWLVVRKNKKASNTETAFKGFIAEVEKDPPIDINLILKICNEKSWSGFKRQWLINLNDNGKQSITASAAKF